MSASAWSGLAFEFSVTVTAVQTISKPPSYSSTQPGEKLRVQARDRNGVILREMNLDISTPVAAGEQGMLIFFLSGKDTIAQVASFRILRRYVPE